MQRRRRGHRRPPRTRPFCRRLCSCFRRGSEGQPAATDCPRSDDGEGTAVRREAARSCFCRRLCSCFRRGSEGQPVATNCPRSGFRFYVSIGRASSWLLLQEEEGYLVLLAGERTSCSISGSGGGSVQETAEH